MFCDKCAGAGEILGNGMIKIECSKCNGEGSYELEEISKKKRIDKKSKAYKDAIKEIMALNSNINREEAVKLFEKTYDQL